jgi:hypothetical protein
MTGPIFTFYALRLVPEEAELTYIAVPYLNIYEEFTELRKPS